MRLALPAFTEHVSCFRHQKPVFAQTEWELPAACPTPQFPHQKPDAVRSRSGHSHRTQIESHGALENVAV